MGVIYKITNDINNKIYIGQTHNSLSARWASHKYFSKFSTAPLYYAMRKYGIENFHIEPIEECPQDKLNDREIYWIQQYESYGKAGYNATRGGDGHWIYNEEDIKDLWDKGYNLRKICRELNIQVNTVKKILQDYPPFIEQREQRYLDAMMDKSYESISVKQYSLDGDYIATYPSLAEAARQSGANISSIMRVCKGRSKYSNGFQWRYADDDRPVNKVKTQSTQIIQKDKEGNIIDSFASIKEASRKTGFSQTAINKATKSNKMFKNYYWIPKEVLAG